ncbi:MAG: pyridoxal-dependent decarboxylase [Bacteroidales bacterium]
MLNTTNSNCSIARTNTGDKQVACLTGDLIHMMGNTGNKNIMSLHIYGSDSGNEYLAKKSIQCGRKVDAVKLWFAWKYFGLNGYRLWIDNSIDMASYAEKRVIEHPSLELLTPRQSFAVCFRYVPKSKTGLNAFNLELRESLRKSGKSIVNYGYLGDTLAIRLITANGELERSDIDLFFDHLLTEAEKLDKAYEYSESRVLQKSDISGI